MALAAYKCKEDDKVHYVFEGEEERLPKGKTYKRLPPNPVVIQATTTYMSEPQLDSLESVYELDRVLTIEAADEREMREFQKARREI